MRVAVKPAEAGSKALWAIKENPYTFLPAYNVAQMELELTTSDKRFTSPVIWRLFCLLVSFHPTLA